MTGSKWYRGGQDIITAVYHGDAVCGGELYDWRHEGTGDCSWEWPTAAVDCAESSGRRVRGERAVSVR